MSAVTWFGHSTTVVELDGTRACTDPVLRRRVAHLVRDGADFPASRLGKLDVVLVSHAHPDHLDARSLARLDRSVPVVVPRGAGRSVRRRGFGRVLEVAEGDGMRFGAVEVEVVHAEHGIVRGYDLSRSSAVGYVLRGKRSVYFAGDTDLFEAMRDLVPLHVSVLPIDGWGPRVTAGHLDARRAAEALRLLQPSIVVPVHWGTFRPVFATVRRSAPAEFVEEAAALAPEVAVRVLGLGETLAL